MPKNPEPLSPEYIADYSFVVESNEIEGILRTPRMAEIREHRRFMALERITIDDLCEFVSVYQKDAQLRDRRGLNVQVGDHIPIAGGVIVPLMLEDILRDANYGRASYTKLTRAEFWRECYTTHQRYEQLHPFTDGNGRSGRVLWMWMMQKASLGFLHTFYYQSLANWRK